jgi:hypothetical protein
MFPGDIDYATAVDNAVDQLVTDLDLLFVLMRPEIYRTFMLDLD